MADIKTGVEGECPRVRGPRGKRGPAGPTGMTGATGATGSSDPDALIGTLTPGTLPVATAPHVLGDSWVSQTPTEIDLARKLEGITARFILSDSANPDTVLVGSFTGALRSIDKFVIEGASSGTFDTTAAPLASSAIIGVAQATRAAGANPLLNIALRAQVTAGGAGVDDFAYYATDVIGKMLQAGPAEFQTQFKLSGMISPAPLPAGVTANYNPPGLSLTSTILQNTDVAGSTLSGLVAQPNGTEIRINNTGPGTLTFTHAAGGPDQFVLPNASPVVLPYAGTITLMYASGAGGWIATGIAS